MTRLVGVWLANDHDPYFELGPLAAEGAVAQLAQRATEILTTARKGSAAWYTAQELAPADYDRVDWAEVARDVYDD